MVTGKGTRVFVKQLSSELGYAQQTRPQAIQQPTSNSLQLLQPPTKMPATPAIPAKHQHLRVDPADGKYNPDRESNPDELFLGSYGQVTQGQGESNGRCMNSCDREICQFCWLLDGKHAKKCQKLHTQETSEQRVRRLKREERMRDQDLGAEYIDAEKQAEKTFVDYSPATPITYKIKIPRSVILGGLLTDLQLEAILYACDQHERMLPYDRTKGESRVRAGFFMADGPGVGKGRQIAGIVLENFLRGRKKAVL